MSVDLNCRQTGFGVQRLLDSQYCNVGVGAIHRTDNALPHSSFCMLLLKAQLHC